MHKYLSKNLLVKNIVKSNFLKLFDSIHCIIPSTQLFPLTRKLVNEQITQRNTLRIQTTARDVQESKRQ